MTVKIITLMTALILICWVNNATAKETSIILIEVEIYNLDKTKQDKKKQSLQAAILEYSPRMMIELGKEATIEIGTQTTDGQGENMFRLQLDSNEIDNNYDIDIELTNKGAERVTSIADLAFNNTFAISTSINDLTKLVKITATQYATLAEAEIAKNKK